MFALLYIVFLLTILTALFGAGAWFGYTIIKPVIKAGAGKQLNARFYTADLFSLTLILALPISCISMFLKSNFFLICVGVIVIGVFLWMWIRGAVKLSSIGVDSNAKRFMFLGFVLPAALIGSSVCVPALALFYLVSIFNLGVADIALLAVGVIAVPVTAMTGQRITAWVVCDAKPEAVGDAASIHAVVADDKSEALKPENSDP